MTDKQFYINWILANGWAEALGLGTTFVLGVQLSSEVSDLSSQRTVIGVDIASIVLGIVLEGVIVGVAQGRVLNRRFPRIRLKTWIIATSVGAGLAWLIGMIPATVMSLLEAGGSDPEIQEPGAVLQLLLAVGLGSITGPILGFAQWRALRQYISKSTSWLWANAIAWAIGMPVIFSGMDFVPWSGSDAEIALSIYGVCLVAGLVVGAVHGLFMLRLLRRATNSPVTA